MIETIVANPTYLAVTVAGAAAGISILMYKEFSGSDPDTIDTQSFEERIKKIFSGPVDSSGSKINEIVKQRGTSNTPQTIGYALKAKEHDVNVLKQSNDGGIKTDEAETVDGVTYSILEGKKKWVLLVKKLFNTLLPIRMAETYDVPSKNVVPGDDYIWFTPDAHFVKYNGVKRPLSPEGMGRVWDSSFAGLHENYLDTFQGIPETYSVLNNRVAGQLNIENTKSQNIRDYKKQQSRDEKDLD